MKTKTPCKSSDTRSVHGPLRKKTQHKQQKQDKTGQQMYHDTEIQHCTSSKKAYPQGASKQKPRKKEPQLYHNTEIQGRAVQQFIKKVHKGINPCNPNHERNVEHWYKMLEGVYPFKDIYKAISEGKQQSLE